MVRSKIKQDMKEVSKFLDYAIIRNFEFLFDSKLKLERDLDILVNQITSTQKQKIENLGYFLISDKKYRVKFAKYFPKQKTLFFLDFHRKTITGNPIRYKVEEQMLANRVKKEGVQIANTNEYLATLLLREILAEGFNKKYQSKLAVLFDSCNIKQVARLLLTSLSRKDTKLVLLGLKKKDFNNLRRIRKRIKKKFVLKNPETYLAAYMYLRQRHKKLVAFIGMDGAGKSTVVDACYEIIKNSGISIKKIYLGRGKKTILPVQGPALALKNKTADTPHLTKSLVYSCGAMVYALDFALRGTAVRRSTLMISDRFTSDILLMPNVPRILKRALYFFLPKADKYVYIYNDVPVLSKRKGHDREDLERQEKEFVWINNVLNSHKLKNEQLGKTVEAGIKLVLS